MWEANNLPPEIVRELSVRQFLINNYLQAGLLVDAISEQRQIVAICLRLQAFRPALTALQQLIGLAPDDAQAYLLTAQILQKLPS